VRIGKITYEQLVKSLAHKHGEIDMNRNNNYIGYVLISCGNFQDTLRISN